MTITGSVTAARLISELAAQLTAVLARRDALEKEIEEGFFALAVETLMSRNLIAKDPPFGGRGRPQFLATRGSDSNGTISVD